jgi:rRNA maturation endonuclease Nob1
VILVLAVAVAVALPLLRPDQTTEKADEFAGVHERLQREKNVALIAIKEAEFDRAMGKLSPDDYDVLKGDYEDRALDAIEKLSKEEAPSAGAGHAHALAKYCAQCGSEFPTEAAFCPGCGTPRPAAPEA